jgi:hypothetical protein
LKSLESKERVKAVMVYIKIVLKPPRALHTTPKLSRKPKNRKNKYVYQKIRKKRIKHIQSEASNKYRSGRQGISPEPKFKSQIFSSSPCIFSVCP